MDWIEFCNKISNIFGPIKNKISFNYDDNKISYKLASKEYVYTRDDYEELKQSVEQYEFKPYSISNEKKYESLVELPNTISKRNFNIFYKDKLLNLTTKETDENITYSFIEASEELIWYIIKDYDKNKKIFYGSVILLERRIENLNEKSLFNLLKIIMQLPFSICIESKTNKTKEQLEKKSKSFLFNIAYNFNYVFKPVSEINEIFPRSNDLYERRNNDFNEIVAPELSYKDELVEQYYMALVSEDPFIKFIGFYHIIEYFFEEVYNDSIIESVRQLIQNPGFSSKRKKDITKLVNLIKNKTLQNKEEFRGNELEALELTLKKFVNISDLINDLNEFDSSLVDYYKNSEVSFSNGDIVDLRNLSDEKLLKKLSSRIYKTRNSLVHSKSNENREKERGIYKPFSNSKELMKEIPLMRYISEAIIINSAIEL